MEGREQWLAWAVELQSIAQAGLHDGKDDFDRERYACASTHTAQTTGRPCSIEMEEDMKQRESAEYEAQLNRETERRIAGLERPDYPFPKRFSRRDYLVWAAVALAWLGVILLGARL